MLPEEKLSKRGLTMFALGVGENCRGTMMERSCVFDGTPWTCYLCESCQKASAELGWQDEYGFGDLRERALEIEKAKMDGGADHEAG